MCVLTNWNKRKLLIDTHVRTHAHTHTHKHTHARLRARALICIIFVCKTYSSSPAFPAISLGFTILDEILAYATVFCCFNPTIEVVTSRLRGWCVLDVFLLQAFTRRGHECQDIFSESVWWNACAHRLDLGLYSQYNRVLRTRVRTHVNSKWKIPSTGDAERVKSVTLHHAGQRTEHTTDWAIPAPVWACV